MPPEAIPAFTVLMMILILGSCTQKMSQKYCITYKKNEPKKGKWK